MNNSSKSFAGTTLYRLALLLVAVFTPCLLAQAYIVGPYTPDANTLYLFHFDEAAGSSVAANAGANGGNCITVTNVTTGASTLSLPPTVTTMLGFVSYSSSNPSNTVNFGNCLSATNTDAPYFDGLTGYDGNNNGVYNADINGTASADAISMTNLNIGNTSVAPTGNSPWTIEALVCPALISGTGTNQEIVCTDDSVGNRGFQFRINGSGQLEFHWLAGAGSPDFFATIPTSVSDPNAFVANNWYHVALTYDGAYVRFYWTRLDPSSGACNQIGANNAWTSTNAAGVIAPLVIGNENRAGSSENFHGLIDEVRISSICRGPSSMMFTNPGVVIVQQPLSQSIDYFQPVTFTVTATSPTSMGYQWRLNGTPMSTATNSGYSIPSVDLRNAGGYDCVVTNTAGFSATSHVAQLIVGADHFLAHRWSFNTNGDTSDSVGGATGTLMGNAVVSNRSLVLDGSTGTYMALPAYMLYNSNYTAATFEFWVNYGTSSDNDRVFDFGNTNWVGGVGVLPPENYVYFAPHSGANHTLGIAGGNQLSQESLVGTGNLDGQYMHVACVVDPPDHLLAIYTNGVLEVSYTNENTGFENIKDQDAWIGRSLFTADSYINASIDEFRVYSGAVSPADLAQSYVQGPDIPLNAGPVAITVQPVNTTGAVGFPVSFIPVVVGRTPISMQWYENGSAINSAINNSATNSILTLTPVLSQNGHTFQLLATNNVGGTNYNIASTVVTLTVTVPETLVWAGVNGTNWDVSTLNWSNSTPALVAFAQYDGVVFDDRGGSRQPAVNLAQSVNLTAMVVSNNAYDYVLESAGQAGSLNGQAVSFVKAGTHLLTLDVNNHCTGSTLIQNGTLQVGNADTTGSLTTGPVTNNATLVFNRTDAVTVTNAISGTGTLILAGTGNLSLSGTNSYSGLTTISSTGVLHPRNSSALGAATAGLINTNGGLVYLDAAADFPNEPLTLGGGTALQKGGSSVSTLGGTVALVSDTTLSVDGGSALNLTGPGGLNGAGANANLTLAGSGAGNVTGPVSLGTGGLTVNGGVWTLGAAVNVYGGKTFINGGSLMVNAAAALGTAPLSFTSDQITMGNGAAAGTLGTFTSFALDDGLRGVTINTTLPAAAGFYVASNAVLTISNAITGTGGITKSGNGTLVLKGDTSGLTGELYIDSNSTNNDGAVRIAAPNAFAGIIILCVSNNNAGTSTLQLDGSAGSLTLSPYAMYWSGRNNTTPTIENIAGNNTFSPGSIYWNTGGGTYEIQSDANTLTVGANIPATAPAGYRSLVFSGSGNIVMAGSVVDGDGGANNCTNSIIKTGSGTLTLSTANSNTGTNYVGAGIMLVDGSTGTNSLTVGGGQVGGVGTINGPTIIAPGGALAPGDQAVGTLAINNSLTLGGTVLIAVNKSLSPSNSQAAVSGVVNNAGGAAIVVTNLNLGAPLAVGNTFKVFNQAVVNGGTMGVMGGGVTWTNKLAVDGTISVVGTTLPVPRITGISMNGTSVVVNGINGYNYGGFYVLSQTNLTVPLSSWTRVSTNQFGIGGVFSVTNAVVSGAPQSFFTIQLQ